MPVQMKSDCTARPVIQCRLKKRNSLMRRLKIQSNKLAIKTVPINPYGTCAADTYLDPATIPSIQEAALMISIDIFQSRQAPSSGGVSIDGYTPSPYRMGNTLLARVRGLLAPYLDPRSMVG